MSDESPSGLPIAAGKDRRYRLLLCLLGWNLGFVFPCGLRGGQTCHRHAKRRATLTFTLNGPRKLSVEPDGKNGPLLLFANPFETIHPKPGDAGVVFLGPGVHQLGRIDLTKGQTLYLAGGAVVIPMLAYPKYHWWKQGRQTVRKTLEELRAQAGQDGRGEM